jgi:hypothetical protein
MNAKTFTESLAAKLTERGWNVAITTENPHMDCEYFGFYATSERWFSGPISGAAYKSKVTGRWNFLGVNVYRFASETKRGKTYRDARIMVEVHGDDLRVQVSA